MECGRRMDGEIGTFYIYLITAFSMLYKLILRPMLVECRCVLPTLSPEDLEKAEAISLSEGTGNVQPSVALSSEDVETEGAAS